MNRSDIEREFDLTRKGLIRNPGKFEGERIYVPYFWHAFLEGCADADNGTTIRFEVTEDDRHEFPELKGRHWVTLIQTDQGFVEEVITRSASK